jgi:hypothetical protein
MLGDPRTFVGMDRTLKFVNYKGGLKTHSITETNYFFDFFVFLAEAYFLMHIKPEGMTIL